MKTRFSASVTLMGTITAIQAEKGTFDIKCRSGDEFTVSIGTETNFRVLKNLDQLDRNRIPTPSGFNDKDPAQTVRKYIRLGRLVVLYGVYLEDKEKEKAQFDARIVHILNSLDGEYLFEETHWWLNQISRLADTWLQDMFGDKPNYQLNINDYTLYRTNLGIAGEPTDNTIQECATLSRLTYGFSSAYLLTGCERYLHSARAGVEYQRETFRSLSHDGKYCFWAHGKRGSDLIVPSTNEEDKNTIPLYEQIYALAGLAQYYRITQEWEVLEDIKRTVHTFNKYYIDTSEYGGYFSHLDYATLTTDSEALGDNKSKKNWNSVGDHMPAYLINLILALDPIPKSPDTQFLIEFVDICKKMLDEQTKLIVEKFPDANPEIPYINERFHQDWTPDQTWKWQQNRAIIGHNHKIAWNLTRVANATENVKQAEKIMKFAEKLGRDMAIYGVDQFRGGIFDCVERQPKNGMPVDFVWGNTKDFWQQEQALLAYLILYGYTNNEEYLSLAREMMAFWNLFFLNHDYGGIYFRVTDDGLPYVLDNYGNKGSHAISGYHAFELNFLAHIYIRAYVRKESFCLYFKPDAKSRRLSINVLPDFFKPGTLEIKRITIDGIERASIDPDNFQIELSKEEIGAEIVVEFAPRT
ncbi:N-acyl-D-glucosamine 2-epimerase [Rivularia sp. IAM M-261]|nr:N-acyl-D-glucosamine 2-epimerase [Rivularia sp. IAM M-261]